MKWSDYQSLISGLAVADSTKIKRGGGGHLLVVGIFAWVFVNKLGYHVFKKSHF